MRDLVGETGVGQWSRNGPKSQNSQEIWHTRFYRADRKNLGVVYEQVPNGGAFVFLGFPRIPPVVPQLKTIVIMVAHIRTKLGQWGFGLG